MNANGAASFFVNTKTTGTDPHIATLIRIMRVSKFFEVIVAVDISSSGVIRLVTLAATVRYTT